MKFSPSYPITDHGYTKPPDLRLPKIGDTAVFFPARTLYHQ